ncbi:MAG: hypothetical protein JO270_19520 [Acidobacteriaceae bacterium]|nr:hypothetical protein [Acidobacteriaceae bacterium]
MEISKETKLLAGILLLTVPSIQFGGMFLLRLIRTRDAGYFENPVRQGLFRAGHAHAGVLVILSLVCQILADAASGPSWAMWIARLGAPAAAILIPLGFFLSVASPEAATPGNFIRSAYIGVATLALSVVSLGVLLVRSAVI